MALLGHVSAQMSLRYARLFDHDRAHRIRTRARPDQKPTSGHYLPAGPACPSNRLARDWRDSPTIKARLAGGYCLRAPAQGACPYANICEHCPNFRTDTTHLVVLAAQRVDAQALAADAAARGWGSFDNALAETVNGYYKSELIYGPARTGPWKTVEDVELATLGWVYWHNTSRLHSYLGDLPPAEFEATFYATQRSDQPLVEIQ